MATVCVVTPVKNGGRYLGEAIESVLHQTLKDWEYVVVDGGSEDNSLSIAKDHERNDRRITVIASRDKGMYDAVFKGFECTTAPICCWIPSDDKLMPWAFEIISEYMAKTGAEWVTGIPGLWDERGVLHGISFPLWYPRTLIRWGFCNGRYLGFIQQASTFFTRRLLNRISPDDVETIRNQKGAGDFFLWTRFARYSALHMVPTVVSGFRKHSANWSSKYADSYFAEISSLGFHVPSSRALGTFMRLLMWPLAFCKFKRIYRDWHRHINNGCSKDVHQDGQAGLEYELEK